VNHRGDEWIRAIELWKSGGAITKFMEENFPKLRDANGDPLPDAVGSFLNDLLWCKIEPRKGKPLNESDIRQSFKQLMENRKIERALSGDERNSLRGEKTDREAVVEKLADTWKVSVATIDRIIYPRKKSGA
jgi:hypothetical protein